MPKATRSVRFEPIEQRVMLASLSGVLFSDLNANGTRDGGEPALSGWTVYLDADRDRVLDVGELSTLTNPSGQYSFTGLAAGYYTVAQVVQAGWQQTAPPQPALGPAVGTTPNVRLSDRFQWAVRQAVNLSRYSRQQLDSAQQWVVGVESDASIDALRRSAGATSARATGVLDGTYVLTFSGRLPGRTAAARLATLRGVSFYYPLLANPKQPRFLPNDPLFASQWHLLNTGQTGGVAGEDANVTPAWDSRRGDGVVVGIVDDGLQHAHPDLAPNYVPAYSYDFLGGDPDPSPGTGDYHGTSVAGVAAARGDNATGVSGSAPRAGLAGLRIGFDGIDLIEAGALSYQPQNISIYSNSWGPTDDGARLEGPGPLTAAALANGITAGRNGKGSIFVWAGGNGRTYADNVNYDGYANSRYTIAVGAFNHNGVQSSYSEPGAPLLVVAPSSGGGVGITTTDLIGAAGYSTGDYTSSFGGTSASAPAVAGVVALMLQANPDLTWRDVQHILARSARKLNPTDADWFTNNGGLHVNHRYGFGAVDAAAAAGLASTWTNVAPEVFATSGLLSVNQSIPDNNSTGITSSVYIPQAIKIESVEVVFTATHGRRGDLRVALTSPGGTTSLLAEQHSNDANPNYSGWVFSSKRSWDEISKGAWTLNVQDRRAGTIGTWNNWKLNIYGSAADGSVYYVQLGASEDVGNLDFGNHDIAPPTVVASGFNYLTGHSLSLRFSEDVSVSLSVSDLVLQNLTTSSFIDSANMDLAWDGPTSTATVTFPGLAGSVLSDGNYRLTLVSSGVSDASGNALSADHQLEFFALGGDANRDRTVDITDLGILATNWQQSPRDFSAGDFNYDGVVDITDLGILAANWQANLPAPGLPIAAARSPFSSTSITDNLLGDLLA